MFRSTLVVIALTVLIDPPVARAQETHLIESFDLGGLPGASFSFPAAINNRGEIVGDAVVGDRTVVFRWSRGRGFRDLDIPGAEISAFDVNNRGQVVGSTFRCDDDGTCRGGGFVWSASGKVRLHRTFVPSSINDHGQMAGFCWDGNFPACIHRNGKVKVVGPVGSFAMAINDRGDAAGWDDGERSVALLWPREGGSIVLGFGNAADINDHGIVSGSGLNDVPDEFDAGRPTVWIGDREVRASDNVGVALRINKRGWVIVNEIFQNAYVWNPRTNARVMLDSSFGTSTTATGINDRGHVVGFTLVGDTTHILLWKVRSADMR